MWTWSSEISNNSDFEAIWHAEATAVQTSPCVEADDVWLVLSRSRPSTHFLPCGRSDSRVKFIWYPWISATWKCKVSWFAPPSFDTLVSVVTFFHPCCPSVHLDNPTHIHAISYLRWASRPNRKFFQVPSCILSSTIIPCIWPLVSMLQLHTVATIIWYF